MAKKPASTPESRLARALLKAASEGVDFQKAFEQIPETKRPEIRALLSRMPAVPVIITPRSKEFERLAESLGLEKGYADVLETQKTFQLLRAGETSPDFGQVLDAFTPEMLLAAQAFQKPTLVLTTQGRSFNDLVVAIDNHHLIPGQQTTYVDKLYEDQFTLKGNQNYASQKRKRWAAHIIEAPTHLRAMSGFDFNTSKAELMVRVRDFSAYKKATGIGGVERWKYAHLMMQSLREGSPIDAQSHRTVLDEDPEFLEYRIPCGSWREDLSKVDFIKLPGTEHDYYHQICFRRSVGGPI